MRKNYRNIRHFLFFLFVFGAAGAMDFQSEIASAQAQCEQQDGDWIAQDNQFYCQ